MDSNSEYGPVPVFRVHDTLRQCRLFCPSFVTDKTGAAGSSSFDRQQCDSDHDTEKPADAIVLSGAIQNVGEGDASVYTVSSFRRHLRQSHVVLSRVHRRQVGDDEAQGYADEGAVSTREA